MVITSYIIDLLFLIGILVTFNSVIQDSQFKLISDRKIISKTYLKGWFMIDLISIFPFDLILMLLENAED
tara:strand:- start:359 stop:568 length:210 start_codon:yes stop_codon:yes gene_type:complete